MKLDYIKYSSIVILVAGSIVLNGCGMVQKTATESDEELIKNSVISSALYSEDLAETEEESPITELSKLNVPSSSASLPSVVWNRRVTSRTNDIRINQNGYLATVNVSTTINGVLRIFDTTNAIEKPFVLKKTRTFVLQKTANHWAIILVSPRVVNLANPNKQTVKIQNIRFIGTSANGSPIDISYSDFEACYAVSALPVLNKGSILTVEAAVTNNSDSGLSPDTIVFMHRPGVGRMRMYDDGKTSGDSLADDHIFTRQIYILPNAEGYHRDLVADALDSKSLQNNNEDDYNGMLVHIPFKVQ